MKAEVELARHKRQSPTLLRVLRVVFCVLVGLGRAATVDAQEMEIPVSIQVPLFLKVLSFDRRHVPHAGRPLVVAVVFQGRNRASLNAKNEVIRIVSSGDARDLVEARAIDIDAEPLDRALARVAADVVYIAPLRALDIADVARVTRAAGVTTFTGVPEYVRLGLAVSVRLQGDRPKLLVNLPASRLEGADFSAELLKLAQVVH